MSLFVSRPSCTLGVYLESREMDQMNEKKIFTGVKQPGNTLKFALIGLPNSGKSSMFNALTVPVNKQDVDTFLFSTLDVTRANFYNPDSLLDWYVEIFGSKQGKGFTSIVADGPALVENSVHGEGEGIDFLEEYACCDVLINVVRCFEDEQLTHYYETIDPVRDSKIVVQELLMADLMTIEKRIIELYTEQDQIVYDMGTVGKNHKWERWTMLRAWHWLVGCDRLEMPIKGPVRKHQPMPERCEGSCLRYGEWNDMEIDFLMQLTLFTTKPMVHVLNVPLREYTRLRPLWLEPMKHYIDSIGDDPIISMNMELEQRFVDRRLDGDVDTYIGANPTHKSAIPLLAQAVENSLNMVTFYTGTTPENTPEQIGFIPLPNDNILKAWRCRHGTTAVEAATLVDPDIARYFNKLTMYARNDLEEENGHFDRLREFNKERQQQKKYVVGGGDVVQFHSFDVPKENFKPPKKKKVFEMPKSPKKEKEKEK